MNNQPIVLLPNEGRSYAVGPMRGTFKASGDETGGRYCASVWTVEPRSPGPGPHHHEAQEEVFVVTEGTMTFLVGETWVDAPAGAFVRIPEGVTHDFENRTDAPAAAFNIFMPDDGFEAGFARWLRDS